MKRMLVCLLLVGVVGCGTPSPEPPTVETNTDRAMRELNKGVSHWNQGQHDEAIANFTKAIELDPTNVVAYYVRAGIYDELGELDKAISDFTKAIYLDLDYEKAYYFRGLAYQERGDKDKADADFAKAKELGYEPPDDDE